MELQNYPMTVKISHTYTTILFKLSGVDQSTESFTFDISPTGDFVVWLANMVRQTKMEV